MEGGGEVVVVCGLGRGGLEGGEVQGRDTEDLRHEEGEGEGFADHQAAVEGLAGGVVGEGVGGGMRPVVEEGEVVEVEAEGRVGGLGGEVEGGGGLGGGVFGAGRVALGVIAIWSVVCGWCVRGDGEGLEGA